MQVCFNCIITIVRINHFMLFVNIPHSQIKPGKFITICITSKNYANLFSKINMWYHLRTKLLKLFETSTKIDYCGKTVFIRKCTCELCKHSVYCLGKNRGREQWGSLLGRTQHCSRHCSFTSKHTSPLMRWEPCILISLQLQSQPSLPTSNINARLTPGPFLREVWECPGRNCSLFPWGWKNRNGRVMRIELRLRK